MVDVRTLLRVSGKFCGNNFPPEITSSGRSLWMRFISDSTIQYTGFKAVYQYIINPMDPTPDIGECAFEASGMQVRFLKSEH